MQDYDRNVLEKYKIDVSSTRKVRGAVLCDTSRGVFLLKEVSAPAGRIPALCELYAHLIEHCNEGVDSIEPNEDGEFVTAFEDGKDICCGVGLPDASVISESRRSSLKHRGIWQSFISL